MEGEMRDSTLQACQSGPCVRHLLPLHLSLCLLYGRKFSIDIFRSSVLKPSLRRFL